MPFFISYLLIFKQDKQFLFQTLQSKTPRHTEENLVLHKIIVLYISLGSLGTSIFSIPLENSKTENTFIYDAITLMIA